MVVPPPLLYSFIFDCFECGIQILIMHCIYLSVLTRTSALKIASASVVVCELRHSVKELMNESIVIPVHLHLY